MPSDPASSRPTITVVVAVRNGAPFLTRCLQSVIGQTYAGRELIVMDGGSTDGSVQILEANAGRIAHWESAPDRGIYHAWNKAIRHASGEWLFFLGADDCFWTDGVLAEVVPHLAGAPPSVRVVYGRVAKVDARGAVLEVVGQPWARIRRRFRQEMCLAHQGVFHRRALFERQGFDESYAVAGDYEFLLRELKQADPLFVDRIVAAWRVGGKSSLPDGSLACLREIARARRTHRLAVVPLRWWWTYGKAVVRRGLASLVGDPVARRITDLYRRLSGRPPIWTR
jgi:hypothetical protein